MAGDAFTKGSPVRQDALRRYLPPSWVERWQRDGERPELTRCVTHLTHLLEAVKTYLPRTIVSSDLSSPIGTGTFRTGTLLFADVSGFTPMTERFSHEEEERGQGAEELTGIVNSYFEVVNHIAHSYGGDLLKFGGDAVLALFEGPGHAAHACRASLEMQTAMGERFASMETSLGVFPLRMKIGLGTGTFFSVTLGESDRLEYAVLGPAVRHMAYAEDLAQPGQVVLDQETRTAATIGSRSTARASDFFVLETAPAVNTVDVARSSPPPEPSTERLDRLLENLDRLTPYLPLGLLEKLRPAPLEVGVESDHRWATTFFAALRGANRLLGTLGEERGNEIGWALNRYFIAMRNVIERYEGVINRVGAGPKGLQLHVLFGAPVAHEDDPERAVSAALDMQAALGQVNRQVRRELHLETTPFRQVIGINTGFVFAGSIGSPLRKEYTVMGDEVNLAARLTSAAPEGKILISASTDAHLSPRISVEERPPIRLKGKSAPVRHFLVQGKAEGARLSQTAHQSMVGRESELERIFTALKDATSGSGRVAVISGEAGIGKTRLGLEVARHASEREIPVFSGRSVSFLRDTVPYLPWTEVLRALIGIPVGGTPGDQVAGLKAGLEEAGLGSWEPLVSEMLGLPVEETSLTASLDPRLRQQRLFDLVLELVAHRAQRQPLLLWFEDLQWADVASLGLLDYVARNVRLLPILLMVTLRPDPQLEERWAQLPHAVNVRLSELDDAARSTLVAQLLRVGQAPGVVVDGVVRRAQGNPLFIEEMVRALIEQGVLVRGPDGWTLATDPETAGVPDTVHGIFQTRLDRLPETERRVLQVASVIGQSFAARVLDEVYPYGDLQGMLPNQLRALSAEQFLTPAAPPADYAFRQTMIQEVAYGSLPHARRRGLHCAIAHLIEESGTEEARERLEFIALHYYRGREWDRALTYLLRAGERAGREYANEAAITHFQRALRAAEETESKVNGNGRVAAHEGLGQVLTLLGRYDEALEHLRQAWDAVRSKPPSTERDLRLAELCHRMAEAYDPKGDYEAALEWLERGLSIPGVEETAEAARLHRFGSGVFFRRGENALASQWCQRSLEIAERLGDEKALAEANYSLGLIRMRQGDLTAAVQHCRRSLALYEELGDLFGQAQAYTNLALAYDMQGAWDDAVRYNRAANEIVQRIGYAEGQARTATNLGVIHLMQGKLDAATEEYRQALSIVERLGHRYGVALLNMNLGAAYARMGEWDRADAYLGRSRERFREIGSEEFLAELCRHRAEVARGQGDLELALERAQRSLEHARANQMELEEGPTWRVLGRIQRERGRLDQAHEALERALSLTTDTDNPYEAARTRVELARLHIQRGQREKGRRLAREAAQTFTELGAQLDLREAKSLIT